jgi:hypothetical protein
MSLPWVRLDTAFPRNPKILALLEEADGYRAAFVWVCGLSYCGEQGSDGFIPRYALQHLHGRPRDAEKLVIHNLWVAVPVGRSKTASNGHGPAGWTIRDWAAFQQSNSETQERKARAQLAARKANCVRWHGPDCGCWESESVA